MAGKDERAGRGLAAGLRRLFPSQRKPVAPAPVPPAKVVSVVQLSGSLKADDARMLSIANVAPVLDEAFGQPNLLAVLIRVNCPGGAICQASMIHKRIRVLALARRVPVLCFIEDVATSGGYWIALAADKIFADETSQIGSIGVVTRQFGFSTLLERLGIERRVQAHGALKAVNDPYLPRSPEGDLALEALQRDMVEHFREVLTARRGERLSATAQEEIGTGRSWTGRQAQKLGLIDGLGDSRLILRAELGFEFQTRLFQPSAPPDAARTSLLQNLLGDDFAGQG